MVRECRLVSEGRNRRWCQLVPRRAQQRQDKGIRSSGNWTIWQKERATYLCTNWRTVDSHWRTYIVTWKTQGGLAHDLYLSQFYFTLHKLAFLCFQTKRRFNTTAVWKMLSNHNISGCLAASGSCMPSAADEGWHSSKRPYSTASTVRQFVQRYVSCPFFLSYS